MNITNRIVHQIWINDTYLGFEKKPIPDVWKKGMDRWKSLPNVTYLLWDDDKVWDFLRTKYPDFISLYTRYEYLIQRADMIRYLILYEFGGVYSDLDLYPAESKLNIFDFVSDKHPSFVYSANSDCYTNALMASPKKSPLFLELMSGLEYQLNNMPFWCIGKHLNVMFSTGPMYLTEKLKKTKQSFIVLPKTYFNPYSIADKFTEDKPEALIHTVEGNSWHSWDSTAINFVFRNKREFYVLSVLLVIAIFVYIIYLFRRFRRVKKACGTKCTNM